MSFCVWNMSFWWVNASRSPPCFVVKALTVYPNSTPTHPALFIRLFLSGDSGYPLFSVFNCRRFVYVHSGPPTFPPFSTKVRRPIHISELEEKHNMLFFTNFVKIAKFIAAVNWTRSACARGGHCNLWPSPPLGCPTVLHNWAAGWCDWFRR